MFMGLADGFCLQRGAGSSSRWHRAYHAMEPVQIMAMACNDKCCDFKPVKLQRRPVGDFDVLVNLKYCGVCHTDVDAAAAKSTFLPIMKCKYPCVPGHELAGVVEKVGAKVTKFQVGDQLGVGCLVDSCLECAACRAGEEENCQRAVFTYQSDDWSGRAAPYPATRTVDGQVEKSPLLGGYSTKIVVHEYFAVKIPGSFPLEYAGPVMCSGITMYSPLRRYGATVGTHVGIVGLGGLGVMGIKLAKQLGCVVTAISRSEAKKELATRAGADHYLATAAASQMEAARNSLDIILDTIPTDHDISPYRSLLASQASKLVILGINANFTGAFVARKLLGNICRVQISGIGGIAATQEVIELCDQAEPKILPEIKIMPVHELNSIFELLDASNDAGIRYVLDIGTLDESTAAQCTAPPPTLAAPPVQLSMQSTLQRAASILSQECSASCCVHCLTCGLFLPQPVGTRAKQS
ncbi:unnamed protein product [Effrenium voratum]|uniref:Enoyl reductase (ER) domain-containing protein n=1 Tax=Effrenium voratum TaxID=2562239 RepID=A0AA36IV72_9DINO|nr:unnamed protein product [Effrenium voratum]